MAIESPMVSRRDAMRRTACGFASLAFAGLASQGKASSVESKLTPHFPPKAKRVIFLFMAGGVSHVDSFDWKPKLIEDDGKMLDFADARAIKRGGKGANRRVMKPLWNFQQRGESGLWASDLFPMMATQMDKLCVVKSMQTEGVHMGRQRSFYTQVQPTSLGRPWDLG